MEGSGDQKKTFARKNKSSLRNGASMQGQTTSTAKKLLWLLFKINGTLTRQLFSSKQTLNHTDKKRKIFFQEIKRDRMQSHI
jgi:hypothetical protein